MASPRRSERIKMAHYQRMYAQQQHAQQQQQQAAQQSIAGQHGPGHAYQGQQLPQAPSLAQYVAGRNPQAAAAAQQQQRIQPHPSQMRQAHPAQQPPPQPQRSYPNPQVAAIPPGPYQKVLQQRENERANQEANFARAFAPIDDDMPEGAEDICIGDGVQLYKKIQTLQRDRDIFITRKMAYYRDMMQGSRAHMNALSPAPGTWKDTREDILQISISNTCENQPWQFDKLDESAFDFESGVDSTYRVTIRGRLISSTRDDEDWEALSANWPEEYKDDESDDEAGKKDGEKVDGDSAKATNAAADGSADGAAGLSSSNAAASTEKEAEPEPPKKKKKFSIRPKPKSFSYFFNRITVEYDRPAALQPDGFKAIEWTKPKIPTGVPDEALPSSVRFDKLEFERKGDENMNVTINLFRDEEPKVYRVSKELAELCDSLYCTREEIVWGLWEYIKYFELPRDETNRRITCDDVMKACFGTDTIYFPNIATLIEPHLFEEEPVQLRYTIRCDEACSTVGATVYNVPVIVPTPFEGILERLFAPHPAKLQDLKDMIAIKERVVRLLQAIRECVARHEFYTSYTKDPVRFLEKYLSSQKRDMEIILGDSRVGNGREWMGAEFRRGGSSAVWESEAVREAAGLMVAQRPNRG